METVRKVVVAGVLAMLVAVGGAWAATEVAMEGDYGKVSWTSWVGKKGYTGYLMVTRQPDDTTYLYYVVQSGNEPPITGYGLIPNSSLTKDKGGSLELSVDTSRVRGFVTEGHGGPVRVAWWPAGVTEVVHVGASGSQIGSVVDVTQGSWTSAAAVAKGDVMAWEIGDQQSAEQGTSTDASSELSSGK